MKIMGLDYGSVTVGVAISDSMLITAQPVETIERKQENKLRRTFARIEELISENEVDRIVVGLPMNMNGTEGERAEKTREFCELLEKRVGLEVLLWDERLTTVSADRVLAEHGVARDKRKKHIDKLAASIILQSYLDSLSDH